MSGYIYQIYNVYSTYHVWGWKKMHSLYVYISDSILFFRVIPARVFTSLRRVGPVSCLNHLMTIFFFLFFFWKHGRIFPPLLQHSKSTEA